MLFLTAILIYDDNYVLYAKLYLVKNSFLAYFVSRTILVVIDHMQEHIFLDFALTFAFPLDFSVITLKFHDVSRFSMSGHPDVNVNQLRLLHCVTERAKTIAMFSATFVEDLCGTRTDAHASTDVTHCFHQSQPSTIVSYHVPWHRNNHIRTL